MKKRHAFRPESLGPLEDRLVLSRVGMSPAHVVAPVVRTNSTTADRATTRFENRFLKGMVPHHQMAIQMAQIAVRNSDNTEVRDLAHRILSEQRPEIRQMQRLLAHNGVRGLERRLTSGDRAMLRELRSLRGTEFDRAFLSDMIGHHEAAVSGGGGMIGASECVTRAAQPSLKQLCGGIVSTQTSEIAQMQMLLRQAGGAPTDDGGMGGHHGG